MKTLRITLSNYQSSDYTYENMNVELDLPEEIAEAIKKFWNDEGVDGHVRATHLCKNQSATVGVWPNKDTYDYLSCEGGMSSINSELQRNQYVKLSNRR